MFEINKEKFGPFVAELRKEKGYTQKELAAKLYISDKAISKWETSVSIPDVSLLIPLSEALGVSVTELLQCQRSNSNESITPGDVEDIVKKAIHYGGEQAEVSKMQKKKSAILLSLCTAIAIAAFIALLSSGTIAENELASLATLEIMSFVFSAYFHFFARNRLPDYYDGNRIGTYNHGPFRMNIPGLSMNNSNWPHIRRAAAVCTSLLLILLPALYFVLHALLPQNAEMLKSALLMLLFFCGLFLPIYLVGKKYE